MGHKFTQANIDKLEMDKKIAKILNDFQEKWRLKVTSVYLQYL